MKKHSIRALIVRLAAAVLNLALVLSLLPLVLPARAEEQTPAESKSQLDEAFGKLMDPGVPEGYSEDMANPYGYAKGQPFLLSERNELLLYYTWNTDSNNSATKSRRYTVWYDSYHGPDGSMDLRNGNNGPQQGGFGAFGTYDTTDAFGYVTAVSFDPTGSGRTDHVAYVGYENKTGRSWNQGYVLWILNTRDGTQYGPFSIGAASWLQGSKADLYAGSNFFNLAAGDFDGDGKDTLVASVTGNGSTNYGLTEIRFQDGGITQLSSGVKSPLHPVFNEAAPQIKSSDGGMGKNKLSMDLAVGDFNGDGVDDLAVVSYPNNGSDLNGAKTVADARLGMAYIGVVAGVQGGGGLFSHDVSGSYLGSWNEEMGYYETAACAGIAAGDLDGNGSDEILVAGYDAMSATDGKISSYMPIALTDILATKKWRYASYTLDSSGAVQIVETQKLDMNSWSQSGSGSLDNVAPQVVIEAAAVNGKTNGEHVFLNGTMFSCVPGERTLNTTGTTLDYFNSADNYAGANKIGKSYLASVAVGNFEETVDGREQIAYVVGLQRSTAKHQYYFSVHMAGGKDYTDGSAGGYYQKSGSYIYEDQEFDLDKRPNCIVVSVDRDDDGILASYRSSAYTWSDPEIMAILQASPYFADVEDYLYDSPDTTYNETVSFTYEYGQTHSVSFGAGAALTLQGTIGGFDLQTGYAMDWSRTYRQSLEKSVTQSFSAGAYDTVVLNRTPVFVYHYDITYQQDGQTIRDTLQLAVPRGPRYEQLSIGGYNAFVSYYNDQIRTAAEKKGLAPQDYEASYLSPVADGLYLEAEGDPFGYYIEGSSSGVIPEKYGDPIALNKVAGISSTEYSYRKSEGTEREIAHGFSFDLTVKFGFDAGFVESSAGVYVSLQYMKGYTTSMTNGKEVSFGGTVMGLNGRAMENDGLSPEAWGFNWQLARWNSNLVNHSAESAAPIPVIGYVLSDVKAPPLPVEELTASYGSTSEDGTITFTLRWQSGDRENSLRSKSAGYRIYLYDPTDREYRLVDTILDRSVTEYQFSGHADGREVYQFAVTAISSATSSSSAAESVPATANFYLSSTQSVIQKIEKTGSDGLTDTYTIYLADGTAQTFTVTNGNGIVSVQLKASDPETGIDVYEILFADGTSTEFSVQNGKDGQDGKDGVGIAGIERIAQEGNVDIYKVTMTDGTFYTFSVANGQDGKDGKDGKDGRDGKDGAAGAAGADGRDGLNGKDGKDGSRGPTGASGRDGAAGKDGKDGAPGADGKDGAAGKDGVGIADIRLDDAGNFLFTMTDGTEINAGAAGTQDSALAEAVSALQTQVVALQAQADRQQKTPVIAYTALGCSGVSLLWNLIALAALLRRRKRARREDNVSV